MSNPDQTEIEVQNVDTSLASLVTKAEYDVQIATARKYPRSIKQFINTATEMVTLNEQIADDCIYALPRGGKTIEGPSVRFAEIILHAWGHVRAGARVIDEDARFVTAQGVCHDLQSNSLIAFEVRRRITDSKGKRYNDDMVGVTGNAASSIALRNSILRVIPKALWSPIYEQARLVCMGDSKTLATRRADAMAVLQKFGITPAMVFAKFQIKGVEDITLEHLPQMKGFATAIRDGEGTVESIFTEHAEAEAIKHIAEAKGKETVDPKTGEVTAEPTTTEQDWESHVDELIAQFNTCKDMKALGQWIDENQALLKPISEKAPPAIQQKWASAVSKKTASFKESKAVNGKLV